MGGAGHEYRDIEFLCQGCQSTDVVSVLVTDENCGDAARIHLDGLHALESLAAGDAYVHQNAGLRAFDYRSISAAAAGQDRDGNSHARQHTFVSCGNGSNYWVKRAKGCE